MAYSFSILRTQFLKVGNVTIAILMLTFFITGCKKDNDPVEGLTAPEINSVELGYNNGKMGYSGSQLHVEAEINAATTLKEVKLQITPQLSGQGWVVSAIYKDGFAGLKKAILHEHFDIPENARAGSYDFLLIARDANGEKTEYRDTLVIENNPDLPLLTNAALNISGSVLTISAAVKAPKKLEKIVVEVQSSAWTRAFEYKEIELTGQVLYDFSRTIDISQAPGGHYHVNITVFDQSNNKAGRSFHFDK